MTGASTVVRDFPAVTRTSSRVRNEKIFEWTALALISVVLFALLGLLAQLLIDGWPRFHWQFMTNPPSRVAERAGILPAVAGSFYLMLLTASISLPLGVGTALYLEEYAPRNFFTRLIELNIANLAAVPSIIYGLLGLQLFVRTLGLERSLLAGAMTLSLLILPIIVLASREAIRNVPRSYREGALALGANRWQAIRTQVLPSALPGILTGCILAFSRAIGETAPLVTMGALTYVAFVPDGIFSSFTALPIQSFNWISRPQEAFHANAAAAICVLLAILLTMNATAIILRMRLQKRAK